MKLGFLFILTLLASLIIYWLIPNQKARNVFLGLASIVFIIIADRTSGIIVILLTVYTYIFSLAISKSSRKSIYHKVSVIGIIIILAFFKYFGLFDKYIFSIVNYFLHFPSHPFEKILLPLGLSYITFKYISYLTDLNWGIIRKTDFFMLIMYGSLFTIFLSGPIERYSRIEKQTSVSKIGFSYDFLFEGFERITIGLFKKFVIADWIGYFIGSSWNNPSAYSFGINVLVLFGFSIQLYLDFAGYSDIAIGTSRLFGLKIMENFNFPYFKENISAFWRSWHISLSDWIRDYVFFPLSRYSDKKVWLLFLVPVISMGICGMWHGSELKFAAWGFYHGAGLSFYQFWILFKKKNKIVYKFTENGLFKVFSVVLTFVFVTIGWLFFR